MTDQMQAAVVSSFDEPPHFRPFPAPRPGVGDAFVVDVLAAALHPRVRSGAAGRHYTSTGRLPMIPGVDGVGRRADGTIVYFVADDDSGTMAERALVDPRRSVPVPDGVAVADVAAAMNPAMSSWVALRRRVPIDAGQSVLVLGATGNAGTMAVRIAKLLGAGRVVGAGRDPERLGRLAEAGADAVVRLGVDDETDAAALADAAAEVDIVLDYLWGPVTQNAIVALLTARSDRSRPLEWIEVGSLAGPTIELPSAALRSAHLRLLGSGQGSISAREYAGELPALARAIGDGSIPVHAVPRPLAEVEQVWTEPEAPGTRTVLVP